MSNKELLDYAVENIKEWDDDYTHLRSDDSNSPLFFSKNDIWMIYKDGTWTYEDGSRNDYKGIYGAQFRTPTAQVITKQEWVEATLEAKEKKNMSTKIERDKEYDLKLTGQDLILLQMLLGKTSGNLLWYTFKKVKDICGNNAIFVPPAVLPPIKIDDRVINTMLDKLFKEPESEEERNLRELKEQYALLGDKIKQMEVK